MSFEAWLIAGGLLTAAYLLYLNALATLVVNHRPVYTPAQRSAQTLIVWLVPLLGALLVLRLLFHDRPDTGLPRAWIPWPLKRVVYGPPVKRYDDAPPYRGSGGGR